ncbi:MAG: hypothetical protein OXF19_05225 [Hyphomicrobiales bacterium]|nr:hypothetical protein [Hyphomicrobiales bacterium]
MNICRLVLIAFSLVLVAACGGGGGGGTAAAPSTGGGGGGPTGLENLPDPLIADASAARELIEAQQTDPSLRGRTANPTDHVLISPAIQEVFQDIAMDAHTLIASDAFITTRDLPQGLDASFRGPIIAHGVTFRASIDDIRKGFADRFNVEMAGSRYTAVMVHRGRFTLAQYQASGRINENENLEYLSYGGWLRDTAFSVDMLTVVDASADGRESSIIVGFSYGQASGSRPTAPGNNNAEWRGSVVGMEKNSGDVIQGDVDMTIRDIANNTLINSIGFTQLVNLNNGAVVSDMSWSGVPTTNEGTFSSTTGGDIDGSFYGPRHRYVGGTFNRDGIIGAFGGFRQGN